MATQEAIQSLSFEAGSDLSAHQFKFVTVAADGQVDLTTSAGTLPTGVLQTNPDAAGKSAKVAIGGRVKVFAGGTIASGGNVSVNNAGLAVATGSSTIIVAQCLSGGASGEVIEVLLGFRGVSAA